MVGDALLPLSNRDIHIWFCPLAPYQHQDKAPFWEVMSTTERERNQRYRFERDQLADRISRALVRSTLAQYVDMPPQAFEFETGEHGKPEVCNAPQAIRINLSHTSSYAVCAVSAGVDVGIDIECTERKNDVLSIADHYFSKPEVTDLFALPADVQQDRFFDYWTLKEAYMKARGEGLSLGLGNFSFALANRASPSISFNADLVDNPTDWFFKLYQPAEDHRMALAVRHTKSPRIKLFKAEPLQSYSPLNDQWSNGL